MKSPSIKSLAELIQSFFCQRLQDQRRVSSHTLASYRDTFRLLLRFLEQKINRSPCQQQLHDWEAPRLLQFLDYLEKERGCQPRTRNSRLAALRAFMRYVAQQEPSALALASRVLAIPMKRFDRPLLGFLSAQELQAIVAATDPSTPSGRRDRLLFGLLYHSGARVSEILALQRQDIGGAQPLLLQLQGKGRKQRAVPLHKPIAAQLKAYLKELPEDPSAPLFTNRFGQALTRSGAAKRLRLTVQRAAKTCPSLKGRIISPHTFRHTTAMHLLQSGIDLTVIALLLGHESPSTTHQYVELDPQMKERCLRKLQSPNAKSGRFKPSDRLLSFLDNL
jgi:site-specific recombinase XerD